MPHPVTAQPLLAQSSLTPPSAGRSIDRTQLSTATKAIMFRAFRRYHSIDISHYVRDELTYSQARLLGQFLTWCQNRHISFIAATEFDGMFAEFSHASIPAQPLPTRRPGTRSGRLTLDAARAGKF